MSIAKASKAAGVPITFAGDGAYMSRVPGLELRGGMAGDCYSAFTGTPGTPQIRTPDGFYLGQSVADLQHASTGPG